MRIVRIYQPGTYQPGDVIELSPQASQHVSVVLRMQVGAVLTLFCGNNLVYTAVVMTVRKKSVQVRIETSAPQNRESPCQIHLAQAISKGERMEWVVQKATELGVASITPVLSLYRTMRLDEARLEKKRQQWQAIAISACEQCGRNLVPLIKPICRLSEYLQACNLVTKFILDPTSPSSWRTYQFPQPELGLLIGPEGGFSQEEITQANQAAFLSMNLGPRILRTETAALSALSLLQAVSGDL